MTFEWDEKLNIMKTMTLDDLIMNPLTEEDKKIIHSAKPVITEDCPELSEAQLKNFKPWYEVLRKAVLG